MKFMKLKVENYKCFQKPVEINFNIQDQDRKNLVLIGGMNGAGKTTVLEAVNICLYGEKKERIYKGINRRELEKGNGNVFFELHVQLDDGDILEIKRNWKVDNHGLNKITSADLQEKLVIVRNQQRLAISDQTGWQDFIERTIPFGISQFFFFNGEKIEYMASDEDAEGRLKESIEALLGIERVKQLSMDLEELRKQHRAQRNDIIDEDIKAREYQLEADRKKITDWKKEVGFLEKEIKELDEKSKELEGEFSKRFGFSSDILAGIHDNELKRLQLNTRRAEIDKEIRQYCSTILPFSLLSEKFNSVLDQIDNERKLRQKSVLNQTNEELADILLERLFKPECIVCRKPFDDTKKEYVRKQIADGIDWHQRSKDDYANVKPLLHLSDLEEKRLEARLRSEQAMINLRELLKEREEILKENHRLEVEFNRFTTDAIDKDVMRELQKHRDDIQQNIGRRKQELRYLDEQISEKETSVSSLERELNTLYEKYSQEKGKADLIVRIGTISTVLNEFVEKLRDSKIQELRKHIFTMYRTLASKSDLIADIVIDPLTYRVKIIDKHGDAISKQNLSAGEKEVFAISLLWGLAKTSNYQLPVIIDTPLARLDSSHRDAIVTKYFPEAGAQVVILSTDTEVDQNYYKKLEPYLARVNHLLFDKYRELTTINEGYFWSGQ
jgi:DNA sulfur modification protein DndD